ncbi:hypothetical protein MHEI_41040 [Mycobacterium heidelbergense]|nr:hypothetical protein MHEI_41040 [Mycobacterium heidelbergense]
MKTGCPRGLESWSLRFRNVGGVWLKPLEQFLHDISCVYEVLEMAAGRSHPNTKLDAIQSNAVEQVAVPETCGRAFICWTQEPIRNGPGVYISSTLGTWQQKPQRSESAGQILSGSILWPRLAKPPS